MSLSRRDFLLAARAARHWPPGRPKQAWFHEDELDHDFYFAKTFPVALARAQGDPATVIAAYYAHQLGWENVPWRNVFVVQEHLIRALEREGIVSYNELLASEPLSVAAIFEKLAEEAPDV